MICNYVVLSSTILKIKLFYKTKFNLCLDVGTGRQDGLKLRSPFGGVGSTPIRGTI